MRLCPFDLPPTCTRNAAAGSTLRTGPLSPAAIRPPQGRIQAEEKHIVERHGGYGGEVEAQESDLFLLQGEGLEP